MTTPDEILARGREEVTKLLGVGVAEQIFDQLLIKKRVTPVKEDDMNSPSGQSTLNRFG
jgi:hypothetical protein